MRWLHAMAVLISLWAGPASAGSDDGGASSAGEATDAEARAQPADPSDDGGVSAPLDASPLEANAADAGPGPLAEDTYPLTRDVTDVLFQKRGGSTTKSEMKVGKVYLTLLPGISTSPSTGALVALTAQGVFLTGPKQTTSPSQAQAVVAFTALRQLFFALRSQVFLPGNKVALLGDWRLWDNVEPTYGLGSQSTPDRVSRLEFVFFRFDESVLFRVVSDWYVGFGYRVDWFSAVKDPLRDETGTSPMAEYGVGADGSFGQGPSLAMMFDSRDLQVRPTRGLFAQVSLRLYPQALGSTTTWGELWAELRTYHRPVANSSRQLLATWLYVWTTVGPVPYLHTPATAWDTRGRTSRAYAAGRFRGPTQLYAEVEYRLGITPDGSVGAVAFFNLTMLSGAQRTGLEAPAPGGGLGVRLLLNKEAGAYLAVDFAVGLQSTGLYFMLGEAF